MQDLHKPNCLRPLLWLPRYWPAIGGSELHTRQLSHELAKSMEVGVLTHSELNHISLNQAVSESLAHQARDGGVTIHHTGLPLFGRRLLQGVARFHESH